MLWPSLARIVQWVDAGKHQVLLLTIHGTHLRRVLSYATSDTRSNHQHRLLSVNQDCMPAQACCTCAPSSGGLPTALTAPSGTQVWAFEPPGGLAGPSLAEAVQDFATSVVLGKDWIPRLTLRSFERLRDEMVSHRVLHIWPRFHGHHHS